MSGRLVMLALGFLLCGAVACKDDPKLKVTGIEPAEADVNGNSYITIKGNRFVADGPRNVKVYFGDRQGTVTRIPSDREIVVRVPPGKAGEVVDIVIVFDPGGQKKLDKALRYIQRGSAPTVDDLDIKRDKK